MKSWRHALCAALIVLASGVRAEPSYPDVVPGARISFPADEGSHPQFRTEWWYVTGWLQDPSGEPLGFQVTFFRSRPGLDEDNPSRFAAKQLLFAHAAISDPRSGELIRAEHAARAGFGLAEAAEGRLDVRIGSWRLQGGEGEYRATIDAEDLRMSLEFSLKQPPLLQGESGFSRKGPNPRSASYYYSLPQLSTRGTVSTKDRSLAVRGHAWFDHEWSSAIMDEQASGWDWIGINLHDGGALMAFQMRNRDGGEHWASATHRHATSATVRKFGPDEIVWEPLRRWRSSRTGIEYPIEWRVVLGEQTIILRPLMDDQENDARGSTGTLYWEGAVRALNERGEEIGAGYLELTGYGERIRL